MNFKNGYCKKCILPKGYTGISFDENDVCSLCNDVEKKHIDMGMKKKKLFKKYIEFEKHIERNKSSNYDCILMLSGGKDSVYMLYTLLKDTKAKILAVTVDLPYESEDAKGNIEKVINKLNVDHIKISPKRSSYHEMLKYGFKVKNQKLHELEKQYKFVERLPCLCCALYMRIIAFQLAKRMNIPYILYCADPVQMLAMDNDIEKIVKNMIDFVGKEAFESIFGETVEGMIESENRPEIIFPYIKWNDYDPKEIVEKLKQFELYDSDPFMTHCSLWGVLNYFSLKHYGYLFYEYDYADEIRRGIIEKESVLKNIEYLKEAIVNISEGEEIDKVKYDEIREKTKGLLTEEHVNYVVEQIKNINNTAQKIGFNLADINRE